jgi:Tfp pilus assembly protein PilV
MRMQGTMRAARAHHIARCRAAARNDSGFSLIEVIVTVAILATCVVALVTVILAALSGTRQETTQATANTILRNYAQSIRAQMLSTCTGAGGTYATALDASLLPSGYSVTPEVGSQADCPNSDEAATPLTLTVTGPSGTSDSDRLWLWLP